MPTAKGFVSVVLDSLTRIAGARAPAPTVPTCHAHLIQQRCLPGISDTVLEKPQKILSTLNDDNWPWPWQGMKRCFNCGWIKPKEEFHLHRRMRDGRQSVCKECRSKEKTISIIASNLISAAKKRSKKKGLPFDLDEHRDEIKQRLQEGVCEKSGIAFVFMPPEKGIAHPHSPSINRIDPNCGYLYSNIEFVCWCLNAAYNNWGEDIIYDAIDRARGVK